MPRTRKHLPAAMNRYFNEVRNQMEWLINALEDSDVTDAPAMLKRVEEMSVEIEHMRDQKGEWNPNRSRPRNRTL